MIRKSYKDVLHSHNTKHLYVCFLGNEMAKFFNAKHNTKYLNHLSDVKAGNADCFEKGFI